MILKIDCDCVTASRKADLYLAHGGLKISFVVHPSKWRVLYICNLLSETFGEFEAESLLEDWCDYRVLILACWVNSELLLEGLDTLNVCRVCLVVCCEFVAFDVNDALLGAIDELLKHDSHVMSVLEHAVV